jgi:multiple sugar transport system ATP-binding protein
MAAAVTLAGVGKRIGDKTLVSGFTLDIAAGEFIVLVGPSGCGKSTTLRMIAGLERISDGTIAIGGSVVNDLAPKDRGVAMVFQNYALYPHLSVEDNISFGLRLAKTAKAEIRAAVDRAAQMLDLGALLQRKPAELSGGQRQRVAMGRAIVRDPKVFLFDEPLSNLDAKLRNTMRSEIKRLHQRLGTTIVYVTHDQVEAMTLADRIVVMSAGRIEQIGTPDELYSAPCNTFVASFMGSPPMNLLPGVVDKPQGNIRITQSETIAIPPQFAGSVSDGQKVVVGVRPEHLAPSAGASPSITFKVRAELIEALGGEVVIHSKPLGEPLAGADGAQAVSEENHKALLARVPGRPKVTTGEAVALQCAADSVLLFDAQSTAALAKRV